MMAEVIELNLIRGRSCWICTRGAWTEGGVFCMEFSEQIDNEQKAAADCPMFEDDPGKT